MMTRIYLISLLSVILLFPACNTRQSQEENLQKLLDSQHNIEQAQEQSVERLEAIKDSLAEQRRTLLLKRDLTDQRIKDMERDQLFLANQIKAKEVSEISEEKSGLENQASIYQDSIELLKKGLNALNSELDSVERNISVYLIQENRTEETLESGISEIDREMKSRENKKQQTLRSLGLLQKRILVADKKLEALKMERQLYIDELDELLRDNASESEKAPFQAKIAEMDSSIHIQQEVKESIRLEISKARSYIADADAFLREMENKIENEYDKKTIIEAFIAAEKKRLVNELQEIQSTRQSLLDEQQKLTNRLAITEQQIASLGRDLELIRNREMSELLQMQADLDKSDASLAEEEITLNRNEGVKPAHRFPAESKNEEMISIVQMENQLDSLNELIKEDKAEIASTRKELAERRAEAAEKRASFVRAIGISVSVLIVVGVALLATFYYLGRRSLR